MEDRGGARFVGLDVGWNINCGYFIYGFLQEIVPCRDPLAERTWTVGVAGHINEGHDVFAEDYPFPPVAEGDIVAILNTGGYAEAMSSTHCLRPIAPAIHLERLASGPADCRARLVAPGFAAPSRSGRGEPSSSASGSLGPDVAPALDPSIVARMIGRPSRS